MSMLARAAFLAYLPHSSGESHPANPAMLQSELEILHSEVAHLINSLSRFQGHFKLDETSAESSFEEEKMAEPDTELVTLG